MSLLTTDIYEGAYLLSRGMQLEKLWINEGTSKRSGDPANGGSKRKVVFQFNGAEVELLRRCYEKGNAETNVIKLKQSLTELKDRMFNLLRTEETERRTHYEQQSAIHV